MNDNTIKFVVPEDSSEEMKTILTAVYGYISLFSTIVVRVALSIVLGVWLNLGVIGIALAMAGDWCVKAAILLLRYKAGKWKTFRVLG